MPALLPPLESTVSVTATIRSSKHTTNEDMPSCSNQSTPTKVESLSSRDPLRIDAWAAPDQGSIDQVVITDGLTSPLTDLHLVGPTSDLCSWPWDDDDYELPQNILARYAQYREQNLLRAQLQDHDFPITAGSAYQQPYGFETLRSQRDLRKFLSPPPPSR